MSIGIGKLYLFKKVVQHASGTFGLQLFQFRIVRLNPVDKEKQIVVCQLDRLMMIE